MIKYYPAPYTVLSMKTLQHHVELVIDGGYCGMEATSVVDLTGDQPEIIRHGCGSVEDFE